MHDHIQRLKLKIREMEVATLANEARLKASEDRLEHQQRINDGNVVLLETLQTQHTNARAEHADCSVLLQNVQAEHAALHALHVRQQLVLANSETERQERQEANDAFRLEVDILRENNEALVLQTTSLKLERNARKKKESNAKRSVLRSFQWREDKVDASVLRGAVGFGGATSELVVDDADEEQKRCPIGHEKTYLKLSSSKDLMENFMTTWRKHLSRKKGLRCLPSQK